MATIDQKLMEYENKFVKYTEILETSGKLNSEFGEVTFPAQILQDIINDAASTHLLIKSEPKLSNPAIASSILDPDLKVTYLQAFEEASLGPVQIHQFYQPNEGMLTLPVEVFNNLKNGLLTWLATIPHKAAAAAVKISGTLAGCKISDFDTKDLVPLGAYCEGVIGDAPTVKVQSVQIIPTDAGKEYKVNYPTFIMHSLGCHGVESSVSATGTDYKMKLKYHDSGATYKPGSIYRMTGVKQRLETEGFKCQVGGSDKIPDKGKPGVGSNWYLYCNNDDLQADTIRQLAIFFSLLRNADNDLGNHSGAGENSTAIVRDWLWEQAGEYEAKYGSETWHSGLHDNVGKWGQIWTEWQKKSSPTYNDLRTLLSLRDFHHMIEDAYKIGNDSHTPTPIACIKAILANAKKIKVIADKNHWQIEGLDARIAKLEDIAAKNKPHPIGGMNGLSDLIGNRTHGFIVDKLQNTPDSTYAGCSTGNIGSNINLGNLAYCEGILKGTGGQDAGDNGNKFKHTVGPGIFTATVSETYFPDYEYALKIESNANPMWKKLIYDQLAKDGIPFDPHQGLSAIPHDKVDLIRKAALFLSNLKGVDESIGIECAKKAIEEASQKANEQNAIGVFAFQKTPIFNDKKQWVKKCFDKYGIEPVGLSKEESSALQLIGPDKIYGGCSFQQSEILPDIGLIKYCEGVRDNPQNTTNGSFNADGSLSHMYHAGDKIADIKIKSVSPGKYSISLSQLHLRDQLPGKLLQATVINRLKSLGLACPNDTQCSTQLPVDEDTLRFLAVYLSSFHQAGHVPANCIGKAEQHAFNAATELKKNTTAFSIHPTPFKESEWKTDVCTGAPAEPIPGAPPPAPKKEPEVTAANAGIESIKQEILALIPEGKSHSKDWMIKKVHQKIPGLSVSLVQSAFTALIDEHQIELVTGKEDDWWKQAKGTGTATAPTVPVTKYSKHDVIHEAAVKHDAKGFEVGGCISEIKTSPTQGKAAYCLGIPTIAKIGTASTVGIMMGKLTSLVGKHAITGTGTVLFDTSGKDLIITLPEGLQHPLVKEYMVNPDWLGFKETKPWTFVTHLWNMQPAFKTALFLSQLTNFPSLDEDCKKKAVEKAWKIAVLKQHGVIDPYDLAAWKEFCKVGGTGKPELDKELVKAEILHWLKDNPGKKFDWSSIKDIITEKYTESSIPVDTASPINELMSEGKMEWDSSNQLYVLLPQSPQVKEWLLNLFFKHQMQDFSYADLADTFALVQAPGFGYQSLDKALLELVAEGNVSKKVFYKGGSNNGTVLYKYAGPTPAGLAAQDDIVDKAIQEHTKENLKLLALWEQQSEDFKKKAGDKDAYKKLPKLSQEIIHNLIDLHLLNAHKNKFSYDNTLKAIQDNILALYPKLTPLMVKLQTDLEKKAKIAKGLLPECEETCTIKVTKYEDMDPSQQEAVKNDAESLYHEGNLAPIPDILPKIMEKYGLEDTPGLEKAIVSFLPVVDQEQLIKNILEGKTKEPVPYVFPEDDIIAKVSKYPGLSKFTGAELYDAYGGVSNLNEFMKNVEKLVSEQKIDAQLSNQGTLYYKKEPGQHKVVLTVSDLKLAILTKLKKSFPNSAPSSAVIEKTLQQDYDFKAGQVIQALNQLIKEKALEYSGDGYKVPEIIAPAKKKGKKAPAAKAEPMLKAKAMIYLSQCPGEMKSVADIADEAGYYKGKQLVLPTKEHVKLALDELVQEGKLLWSVFEGKYQFNGPAAEQTGKWFFTVTSAQYGTKKYGPYETELDAIDSIASVKANTDSLNDGIIRTYSDPFFIVANIGSEDKTEYPLYTELSEADKELVNDAISKLVESGYEGSIADKIEDTFNVTEDDAMFEQISHAQEMHGVPETSDEGDSEPEDGPWNWYEAFQKFAFGDGDGVQHNEEIGSILEEHGWSVTYANGIHNNFITSMTKGGKTIEFTGYEEEGELVKKIPPEILADMPGYQATKPKEEATQSAKKEKYQDLSEEGQENVAQDIANFINEGLGKVEIADKIMEKYNLEYSGNLVNEIQEVFELKKAPEPVYTINEEVMASFIKQGMNAKAIEALFAGTIPPAQLKSTAHKLYDLYHTDEAKMTIPMASLPNWMMSKLHALAESMLLSGKTQDDTIWYISYHFNMEKGDITTMVKEIAKKPVIQQKQLLETTIKILKVGESLAGCTVGDENLDEVTASTVAYCQGVIKPFEIVPGEKEPVATTEAHGTEVKHMTWTQEAALKTDTKHGGRTTLHYESSSFPGGIERAKELNRILDELGFTCEKGESEGALYCDYTLSSDLNLPIADQDNIRKAALLISSIDKIDKLPLTCIPKAMEYAKNHSIGISKTGKPWTVPVYPETIEDWEKMVCSKVT